MPKFKKGERVWYVPDHAEDATHRDAEAGIVLETNVALTPKGHEGYLVDYKDGSGVAKLTYERHLQKRDT